MECIYTIIPLEIFDNILDLLCTNDLINFRIVNKFLKEWIEHRNDMQNTLKKIKIRWQMYAHCKDMCNQHICVFNCPFCPNVGININPVEYDNNTVDVVKKFLIQMREFSEKNIQQCKDHINITITNKKENCQCPFCGILISPQAKIIYKDLKRGALILQNCNDVSEISIKYIFSLLKVK